MAECSRNKENRGANCPSRCRGQSPNLNKSPSIVAIGARGVTVKGGNGEYANRGAAQLDDQKSDGAQSHMPCISILTI
jgi:hypothetical protein